MSKNISAHATTIEEEVYNQGKMLSEIQTNINETNKYLKYIGGEVNKNRKQINVFADKIKVLETKTSKINEDFKMIEKMGVSTSKVTKNGKSGKDGKNGITTIINKTEVVYRGDKTRIVKNIKITKFKLKNRIWAKTMSGDKITIFKKGVIVNIDKETPTMYHLSTFFNIHNGKKLTPQRDYYWFSKKDLEKYTAKKIEKKKLKIEKPKVEKKVEKKK